MSSLSIARTLLAVWLFSLCACRTVTPPVNDNLTRRTVTDELNRQVAILPNPQRIISLAPNLTEMLFALGLGARVIGVTSYCDFPPEAKTKEQIGNTLQPNLERIIALKPDLVLVTTSSQLEVVTNQLDQLPIVNAPHQIFMFCTKNIAYERNQSIFAVTWVNI